MVLEHVLLNFVYKSQPLETLFSTISCWNGYTIGQTIGHKSGWINHPFSLLLPWTFNEYKPSGFSDLVNETNLVNILKVGCIYIVHHFEPI